MANINFNRSRIPFTVVDDLNLLREVVHHNPFAYPMKWQTIVSVINTGIKTFTLRALRDRVKYLLTQFRREDGLNRRKSGTEEECSELTVLLQEISDLDREFGTSKKVKTSSQLGVEARTESAHLLSLCEEYFEDNPSPILSPPGPSSTRSIQGRTSAQSTSSQSTTPQATTTQSTSTTSQSTTPQSTSTTPQSTTPQSTTPNDSRRSRKRKSKDDNLLEFVKDRQESENEMQLKKLDLEREKLEFEKRKFEFECEMRKREQENEKEMKVKEQDMSFKERMNRIDLERAQMKLMVALAEKLTK